MNKQIYEKMRDISVLFSSGIPAPLPGVQAAAVNSGDDVRTRKAWKGIFRGWSLFSRSWTNSIKHSAGTSRCSPRYQNSTLSHFPWETLNYSTKSQTLEPVKPGLTSCLYHCHSLWPWTTVKTTGLWGRLNKITYVKCLPCCWAHTRQLLKT